MLDVLFVCYGNICRSPMAEALLDDWLRRTAGSEHDVAVGSAGVGAVDGARPTAEAIDAMASRGIDITAHRSRRLDASLARRAKRIYCAEPSQVSFAQSLAPDAQVELLAGGVEDPIGCGAWVYDAVARKLEYAVDEIGRAIAGERGVSVPSSAPAAPPPSAAATAAAPGSDPSRIRVALGSDHAGYRYKELYREHLEKAGYLVTDFGAETEMIPTDYTVVSAAVARAVASGAADRGVIVAGSGNGEAIVANKIRGVRATVCNDMYTAEMARRHNDANVLCVGQRACGEPVALKLLDIWMTTPFEGGRHQPRIDNIARIEATERGE